MANFLASIFGTEQDKVNCSFYYKASNIVTTAPKTNTTKMEEMKLTLEYSDRRLQTRRPVLAQARQAII